MAWASLHARCLNAVSPQTGEAVLHIGCGTGYYTALLAMLVGRDGHVEAREIVADQELSGAVQAPGVSGSRGVICAHDTQDFARAFERIRAILAELAHGTSTRPCPGTIIARQ